MLEPSKKPHSITPADDLDGLRGMFIARLQTERMHLATLSAALSRAEGQPSAVFHDLVFRAHRLRGGAAIFEFPTVAAAAEALEQAARAAGAGQADHTDAAVWGALVELVNVIGPP